MPKVIFEGDCLQVVIVANCKSPSNTELCSIMFDIHFLMNLAPNWKVILTYQDANRIAHLLAKHACNVGENHIWVEESPFVISEIL